MSGTFQRKRNLLLEKKGNIELIGTLSNMRNIDCLLKLMYQFKHSHKGNICLVWWSEEQLRVVSLWKRWKRRLVSAQPFHDGRSEKDYLSSSRMVSPRPIISLIKICLYAADERESLVSVGMFSPKNSYIVILPMQNTRWISPNLRRVDCLLIFITIHQTNFQKLC